MIVRSIFNFLDDRGDRKLAHDVFNRTQSTDALKGYTELRKAKHPSIAWQKKRNPQRRPALTEGASNSVR
jgi:hypothetical protein